MYVVFESMYVSMWVDMHLGSVFLSVNLSMILFLIIQIYKIASMDKICRNKKSLLGKVGIRNVDTYTY